MKNYDISFDTYRKHDWDKVKDVVELFANPKNITRENLVKYFSNRQERLQDGIFKVLPPLYQITDYFDLPPNIINQDKVVPDTTFGIFIFNSLVLNNSFGKNMQYINKTLDGDTLGGIISSLSKLLLEKAITVKQFAEFYNTINWLGYQTEMTMPGVSLDMIVPNERVKQAKKELFDKHPQYLNNEPIDTTQVAQFIEDVQKPLMKVAKDEMNKDPSSRLYEGGKPSFGNNYKNTMVMNGPMMDITAGKYRINPNSFNDGATQDNFDLLANKAMYASYSRGVNTRVGGTYAKYVAVAMQNVSLGPKDSDCGTKGYIDYPVTKANYSSILYNYMLDGDKEVVISPNLEKTLIGKTIKMRSPLYCKMKDHICNKCAGELYYKIGIEHIGLTAAIPMNSSMNKSMKKMHDLSVKTVHVDLKDFIFFSK